MTGPDRRQGLRLLGAALLSLLGAGTSAAQAQGQRIWRCGADGRQFSDRPCSDGQAVAAPPPVSADAVQEAQRVARREQALAEGLAQQRLQRNQTVPGEGLQGIRSTQGPVAVTSRADDGRRRQDSRHKRPSHKLREPAGDTQAQRPVHNAARRAARGNESRKPPPADGTSASAVHAFRRNPD